MTTRLKAAVEIITPKTAQKWLEVNNRNRRISQKRVKILADAMLRGEWKINGDSIRFDKKGQLIDGQTRLAAVVHTKKPIESLVIRGLDTEAMTTIDIGKPRTNGDHLSMAGYTGSVFAIASAVGICLAFNGTGKYNYKKSKSSPDELLNFLRSNKRLLKSAEIYTAASHKDFAKLVPQSIAIACHYMFCNIDQDRGESFFHHLVEGINLGKTSPILKLRTELISMRQDSKRTYVTRHAFLHFLTEAFKLYLDDRRVDSLPEYKKDGIVTLPKKK